MKSLKIFVMPILGRLWDIRYPIEWVDMHDHWHTLLKKHARGSDFKRIKAFQNIEEAYGMQFTFYEGREILRSADMLVLVSGKL